MYAYLDRNQRMQKNKIVVKVWPMSVTNVIINLLIYYYTYMFVEFILYSSFEMLQFLHCF